ncbi:hypothetical protein DUNSADRAFT_3589 [Dunaliella salina]|uniref:Uncharacterized protein n=1 Tax=Dunaliella salina TaxID=3046 RepID=A0ABQ7GTR1_DUNSA|nr:hypothetical protein DUNSADRAFT_3589 [Dunaliella salina]|eukprot:KAF5837996.1 hypothetical protein DUNSADRAFT_3589 [Dunaliella salina]
MKRTREEKDSVGFQPMLQVRHVDTTMQDSISILMHAARRRAAHQAQTTQQGAQKMPSGPNLVPCTHCGCHLAETQLAQCCCCCDIFCPTCSTTNYDAHEDRVFCLDCSCRGVDSSGSGGSPASNSGGNGAWGQSMAQNLASASVSGCQASSQHSFCHGFSITQYCNLNNGTFVGQSVGL